MTNTDILRLGSISTSEYKCTCALWRALGVMNVAAAKAVISSRATQTKVMHTQNERSP